MAGFLAIPQVAASLAPTALQIGGAGAAAAGAGGASMGFMQALLGTPKGLAALGQGVGMLGKVAGMMIGGKKGAKIAQSAGMFGLVAGLAPSIAVALGPTANTVTPLDSTTTESGGDAFNYSPLPKGILQDGGRTNLDYMGILSNTFA